MKKLYRINILIIFVALLSVPVQARPLTAMVMQDTLPFGQTFVIPEKPSTQTSVYDYANILNGNERQVLENKLVRYADSTSTQIVLITIVSLQGESIGELTPRWAHEWGIGQADKDNGVLILLAKEERQIWIAPGYGVDDRLTAGVLGEMTRNVIIPEFKTGNYYSGLDKGADAIFLILKGKYKEERDFDEGNTWAYALAWLIVIVVVFAGLWLFWQILKVIAKGGGTTYSSSGRRSYSSGSSYTPSRSSSSSRSSSRSGFRGGFGGGGFSGGGAGGSW